MKDGVVQQVGTPQATVYARPATLDVARFMGYRNVLPVQVAQANGAASPCKGPAASGLPARPCRRNRCSRPAAMAAIRPDEIEIGDGPQAFAGTVETAEYGGREWLLQVKTAFDDCSTCARRAPLRRATRSCCRPRRACAGLCAGEA
jgi:putative spermidine/putrescine transport system ATP-binding protein